MEAEEVTKKGWRHEIKEWINKVETERIVNNMQKYKYKARETEEDVTWRNEKNE